MRKLLIALFIFWSSLGGSQEVKSPLELTIACHHAMQKASGPFYEVLEASMPQPDGTSRTLYGFRTAKAPQKDVGNSMGWIFTDGENFNQVNPSSKAADYQTDHIKVEFPGKTAGLSIAYCLKFKTNPFAADTLLPFENVTAGSKANCSGAFVGRLLTDATEKSAALEAMQNKLAEGLVIQLKAARATENHHRNGSEETPVLIARLKTFTYQACMGLQSPRLSTAIEQFRKLPGPGPSLPKEIEPTEKPDK